MRSVKEKRIWLTYFLTEVLIFLVLMYTMITMDHTIYDKIQFVLIAINFALMLYFVMRYRSNMSGFRDYAIPLALTVTLIADVFTCLVPDLYVIGVIAFCMVQTIYMLYLGVSRYNLLARVLVFIALFIAAKPDTVFLYFGCYSMTNLVVNVATAWYRYAKSLKSHAQPIAVQELLLFAVGISCFLGCDTSIMIRGLTDSQSAINIICNLLAWVFYTPSQILINTARFISYPKQTGVHCE